MVHLRASFTKTFDQDIGLLYMLKRWYDPNLGQFVSSSPFLRTVEPSYSFANSNPAILVDPLGLYIGEGLDDIVDPIADFLIPFNPIACILEFTKPYSYYDHIGSSSLARLSPFGLLRSRNSSILSGCLEEVCTTA